jgi:hypothetical protein
MQTNAKMIYQNINLGGIKRENLTSAPIYEPSTDHSVFVTCFSNKMGNFIIFNQKKHNLCIYTVLLHENIKNAYMF